MNKDIIKKHLIVLKEESEAPGLTKTKKIRDESGKTNKAANKDVAKQMKDYDKPLKDDSKPVKNEYTSKEEEYHNQMEIMNGQEMAEYGNEPSEIFKKRAEEAIAGSARMGNSPDYANVVTADQAGFTGPKFGENLVKTIKASKKKRDDAETVRGPKTTVSGADIKDSSMSNKGSKSIALSENKINKKSKMKRLVFKKEFKGIENALNVIPESYKVDGKEFHMTDGNEKYEIKWEGSLTEGRAVVLKASDKNLMTEDMAKMKHLMGYSSQDTLGTVKGADRLDENKKFTDIWGKTKNLMTEMTGGYGFTNENNFEEWNIMQNVYGTAEVNQGGYNSKEEATKEMEYLKTSYPGEEFWVEPDMSSARPDKGSARGFDDDYINNPKYGMDEEKKDFPDLTGDGKVTQADILKGRGVFEEDEGRPVRVTYKQVKGNYIIDKLGNEYSGVINNDDFEGLFELFFTEGNTPLLSTLIKNINTNDFEELGNYCNDEICKLRLIFTEYPVSQMGRHNIKQAAFGERVIKKYIDSSINNMIDSPEKFELANNFTDPLAFTNNSVKGELINYLFKTGIDLNAPDQASFPAEYVKYLNDEQKNIIKSNETLSSLYGNV